MNPALTRQPLDRRQAARRADLVDVLLPVVERLLESQPSYLELRVEEIIRSGGIGRSTFYRYFYDKNDLLLAIAEPAMGAIFDAALAPWQLGPDTRRQELTQAIRRTIDAYRPHIALMNAMVEVSAYDARVKDKFVAGFGTVHTAIAQRISQGQLDGYFRRELDADETAGWVTWMAERGMYQLVPQADDAKLERLVTSFSDIVWFTFYDGRRL